MIISLNRTIYTLAQQLGMSLKARGLTLTTAESCTGGWIAAAITSIPGSSAWLERGFVTYSNAAKHQMLGVQQTTLAIEGAVSQQTAYEMAEGALQRSTAHLSVAVTGIAGPDGGTVDKPVGTVWIAWALGKGSTTSQIYHFSGDRSSIRAQAVQSALKGLLYRLQTCDVSQSPSSQFHPLPDEQTPPVITIDGPSGTGKGTISQLIAHALGWRHFDSGALFRLVAYAALQQQVDLTNEQQLQTLATNLNAQFLPTDHRLAILYNHQDVTELIRSEECGNVASKIAVFPLLRSALLMRQRALRQWPGLVVDGRDMGTVVFPDASLKFFLLASAEERAKRRHNQLKSKEVHASLEQILQDLAERDTRDKQRKAAPLKAAADAIVIDTTELTIEQTFVCLMQHVKPMFA